MFEEIKRKYTEEVSSELDEVNRMKLGDDEYSKTVTGMNAMTDRIIKMEEIKLEERRIEVEALKVEAEKEKTKGEKFINVLKTVGEWAIFLASMGVTICAYDDHKRFERDYTDTTTGGKHATKNLLTAMERWRR